MSNVVCFSNPLVPCDAITIPQISLYPWKEGYGHGHGHGHHAPVVHHAAPLVHHVTPSTHHAPVHHAAPHHAAPAHHGVYHAQPVHHAAPYSPTPAPYSPAPLQYGASPTKITPFVHTPLHRFNAALGK